MKLWFQLAAVVMLAVGTVTFQEGTLDAGQSQPWVTLKGRVTGIEAARTPATSISLFTGAPLTSSLTAAVNADGSFEFPRVLPGVYQARLTPSPDPLPRMIVVRTVDPFTVEIPMTLPPMRVEGRATSRQLKPGQSLRATLGAQTAPWAPTSVNVAPDGSFVFPAVQPGFYELSIAVCESDVCDTSAGLSLLVDRDITGLLVSSQGGAGQPLIPVATVTPAEVVEGTVVMEGVSSVPSFRLRFVQGAVTRTLSVSEKSFAASLLPGQYAVVITDLPAGYELRSITDGISDLRTRTLNIVPTPSGFARSTSPAREIIITLGAKQ